MTQVVEYSVTQAELSELAEKYAIVPDAKTDTGYQAIKACLKETTPLRTAVEKRRKELKKDALEYGRLVDSKARDITDKLVAIEAPYREAKKTVDDEAERIEEEKRLAEEKRIQMLIDRITFINQQTEGLLNATPAMIQERIDWIVEYASLDTFDEYTEQALTANNNAMNALNEALKVAKELEAQKAEQDRVAKEQAEAQAALDRKADLYLELAKRENEAREKLEAEQAEVRRQQEEVERNKREEEARKLAAERAEAEKVKQEKEDLETMQRELDDERRRKEEAEAEALKQEALRPDFDKLEAWASEIRFMEGPDVEGEACQQLINEALRGLGAVSNKLFAGIKKAKAA